MALLAATQGTPERLWAVVKVLEAHGGTTPRIELQRWLKPRYDGVTDRTRDETDRSLVNQTLQAASGLGLIDSSRDSVSLLISSLPSDINGFADAVHGLLLDRDEQSSDADILDAYACVVVQCEKVGNRQWLSDWTTTQIADLFTRSLSTRSIETNDQRYNTSRHAAWMRWIEFVGLNEKLSSRTTLVSVTGRLYRALRASDLPRDKELLPEDLLDWVASTLPYLDNGKLFLAAAKRMGHIPGNTISRILSSALRDLHEDEVLRLVVPRGDARIGAKLAMDSLAQVEAFNSVILSGNALDA